MKKISTKIGTPWVRHKDEWNDCERCVLFFTRRRTVLFRGTLPCDVLFVGEAPGRSEDVLGIPFVGPAGQLLDRMIHNAGLDDHRLGFTNLVACIPLDSSGDKTADPPEESLEACSPRVDEIGRMSKAQVVVLVGKLSEAYAGNLETDSLHTPD